MFFKLTLLSSVKRSGSFHFPHIISISDISKHSYLVAWCVCCVITPFHLQTQSNCFTPVQTYSLLYVLSMKLDGLWCRSGSESDVNGKLYLVGNETRSASARTLKTMTGLCEKTNNKQCVTMFTASSTKFCVTNVSPFLQITYKIISNMAARRILRLYRTNIT